MFKRKRPSHLLRFPFDWEYSAMFEKERMFLHFQNFRSAVFSFFTTNFHLFFPTMPFETPIFLAYELSGKESRHYILLRVIMRSTGCAVQYWGITLSCFPRCKTMRSDRQHVSNAMTGTRYILFGCAIVLLLSSSTTAMARSLPQTFNGHDECAWWYHAIHERQNNVSLVSLSMKVGIELSLLTARRQCSPSLEAMLPERCVPFSTGFSVHVWCWVEEKDWGNQSNVYHTVHFWNSGTST